MIKGTKKVNVLVINYRSDIGGGPKIAFQIVEALNQFGIIPHIFCRKEPPFYEMYKTLESENKVNLVNFDIRKFSIIHFFKLGKYIKENDIKIIHSHGKGAGIWSRLIRVLIPVKVVHTFHGLHFRHYPKLYQKVYLLIERILLLLTDNTISVSKSEEKMALLLGFTNKHKSLVINNGVDISKFYCCGSEEKMEIRKKIKLTDEPLMIIGSVSRFSIQKNIPMLFEIVAEFKKVVKQKFKFVFGGMPDDISLDEITKLINEKEIQDCVRIVDGRQDIATLMRCFDVYLSASSWEGLPTTILEASACGIPIVASKVVGNIDAVIDEKTGYLIPFENGVLPFVDAILRLQKSEIRKKLGDNGRKLIEEKFSVDSMRKKHADLYYSIIN